MNRKLEILNELKMNAPLLYEMKEQEMDINRTDQVDETYFNQLQDIVLSQYYIEQKTMKHEGIPNDYFAKMQNQVLNEVVQTKSLRIVRLLKYASVIAFIIVSALAVNKFYIPSDESNYTNDSLVQMVNDFSDDELLMVLDDYTSNKYNFNLLMDKGIVNVASNEDYEEEKNILNYFNVNEYELFDAY